MISIKSLVLSLDVIHSAKYLFPNVLSVLVLHPLSKINSRSNSFLSLTKFIISSLNSSLFPYSLVKNFPPFLFKVPSSSFIYSSCIAFRRLGFAHVSLSAKILRRSLSHSYPYPTSTNVFTLLIIVLAPIATRQAFPDIISG